MVEPPKEPANRPETERLQPFPRRGESFVQPASYRPATKKLSIFNDPSRPESLAINVSLAILVFPLIWFGLLILWAIGGTQGTDAEQTDIDHALILAAVVVCALAIVGVSVHWVYGRHRLPPAARKPFRSTKVAASAVLVLAVSGGAAALGIKLWNTVI